MSAQTEYITKGSSQFSVIVNLLQDNSGTNPGDPLTGLVYNSTNLSCYYKSGATGSVTALTLATQTSTGAFSLGGFAQLSSANMPGAYRLDLSTTLFSSGDNFGQVMLANYVDLAPHSVHVKFTDLDFYSSINSELTSYGVSILTSTSTILLSSSATSAQLVDDIWDEPLTAHTVNQTPGKVIKGISEAWISAEGAVNDAAATTTSFVTDLTSAVDNFYNDTVLVFITGSLTGQSRPITTYNGTTKAVTFDEAFTSAPANTDQFIVLNGHTHPVTEIRDAILSDSTPFAGANIDAAISSRATSTDIQDALPSNFSSLAVSTDGIADANVQKINDVTITGDGSGTPFNV